MFKAIRAYFSEFSVLTTAPREFWIVNFIQFLDGLGQPLLEVAAGEDAGEAQELTSGMAQLRFGQVVHRTFGDFQLTATGPARKPRLLRIRPPRTLHGPGSPASPRHGWLR